MSTVIEELDRHLKVRVDRERSAHTQCPKLLWFSSYVSDYSLCFIFAYFYTYQLLSRMSMFSGAPIQHNSLSYSLNSLSWFQIIEKC